VTAFRKKAAQDQELAKGRLLLRMEDTRRLGMAGPGDADEPHPRPEEVMEHIEAMPRQTSRGLSATSLRNT
jgi:hypothetical protein